jgi:hypothetical protein
MRCSAEGRRAIIIHARWLAGAWFERRRPVANHARRSTVWADYYIARLSAEM